MTIEETTGAPIVLLHGVGCTHAVWDDVVAQLSTDGDVHAFDLPDAATVPAMAAAVRRRMEDEGLEAVVLVGHSLGGMVAQELACTDATGLRALVACNTVPAGGERIGQINEAFAILAEAQGAAAVAAAMTPHLVGSAAGERAGAISDALAGQFVATGEARLAAQLRAVEAYDVTDRLPNLRVPTLVVAGTEEPALEAAHTIAALVPGAESWILPGGGHMTPMEAPAAFANALRSFLEALDDVEVGQ